MWVLTEISLTLISIMCSLKTWKPRVSGISSTNTGWVFNLIITNWHMKKCLLNITKKLRKVTLKDFTWILWSLKKQFTRKGKSWCTTLSKWVLESRCSWKRVLWVKSRVLVPKDKQKQTILETTSLFLNASLKLHLLFL